jgi:tryptophan-rich sensory protein
MSVLQQYTRALLIAHLASTLFMVGMIWTIHYVHYPLFAYVGESTYVAFQSEHVNRIGKLLLFPWLIEGVTLLAVLILAFLGQRRDLRLPAFLNGLGMAIALIISGVWSAPAHGELADGFDAAIHDRLMTANLVRSFAWTLCGICAVWIVARVWNTDVRNNESVTHS